jgi:hypothetical protein
VGCKKAFYNLECGVFWCAERAVDIADNSMVAISKFWASLFVDLLHLPEDSRVILYT